MKVIGIDVGPAKGGHICDDGKLLGVKKPADLNDYLKNLPGDVLIAWDAPLTGSGQPEGYELTIRPIERFFRQGSFKVPKEGGISVLPYSGCSHWTITQRLLGLPRIGPYHNSPLPFALITNDQDRPSKGRHVVEVHPAVALWRWCKADGYKGPWKYKSKRKESRECRAILASYMSYRSGYDLTKVVDCDDKLDAWIAWFLADSWLNYRGVMLLGNESTGCFLLPEEHGLKEKFGEAARQHPALGTNAPRGGC